MIIQNSSKEVLLTDALILPEKSNLVELLWQLSVRYTKSLRQHLSHSKCSRNVTYYYYYCRLYHIHFIYEVYFLSFFFWFLDCFWIMEDHCGGWVSDLIYIWRAEVATMTSNVRELGAMIIIAEKCTIKKINWAIYKCNSQQINSFFFKHLSFDRVKSWQNKFINKIYWRILLTQ